MVGVGLTQEQQIEIKIVSKLCLVRKIWTFLNHDLFKEGNFLHKNLFRCL